ncbi:glycerophosphodiester phosphodiesterase GDPDL3-like [Chenopodium quinoa]|uniref:glycerophosphodiester phosphodiesterase GDPDL3-like n=1 Tax=Chenopodium quinoa TaxID=63459 RepID=UPI000B78C627|nr:glycerophosphodiester phosphodiesterase GDPDL3-like [Chenopodium quinoa]
MGGFNLSTVVIAVAFLLLQLTVFSSAQKSQSNWLTLDGSPPLVIARNGFSGLFPPASAYAYNLAMMTSVPDLVLWCDVQLTKDGAGICFRDIMLDNSSSVNFVYPKRESTYNLNGDRKKGYFPVDFTLKELSQVTLTQGIYSRSPDFDGSLFRIQTVEDVFMQNKPAGFWLNIQNDAFYSQHKLSMRSFVISASKRVIMSHISSSEVKFLQGLARPFAATKTKLIFQFLDKGATEPSTNQTYGSLLKNLSVIKKFAAGILVPKSYIWPVDPTSYLQPHTSLVADAHKNGLEVFASDFANDATFAYNYSYNPVNEYLSYIDNGDFSVDGLLSDFPITPSEARECFAHLGKNAPAQAKPLVISHHGASGDFPDCTDVAYEQAIKDGADVIDCNVQMSKDGIPFCSSTINLMNSTLVGQTQFRSEIATIKDIGSAPGIYSFSLKWADIQGLTPVISNPYTEYFLYRNPKSKSVGKIISLADFLNIAKNATSLHGVLIRIENANYLALNEGYSITDAVSNALEKGGYNGPTAKKVMIQSTNSSVLKAMKGKKYELVYEVDESISGAPKDTIASIKTFADSVVVNKQSIFPTNGGFLTAGTNVVQQLQSVKLPVYVHTFRNEFVSQAYDFFSDPIVEINSYVMEGRVDGVITDFPKTVADYKKNLCLKEKNTPAYMSPVQPGQLMQLIVPSFMPPAEAPYPFLSVADVSESPLPDPVEKNASAPTTAETPKTSRNSQNQISASALLSFLSMIVAAALLF